MIKVSLPLASLIWEIFKSGSKFISSNYIRKVICPFQYSKVSSICISGICVYPHIPYSARKSLMEFLQHILTIGINSIDKTLKKINFVVGSLYQNIFKNRSIFTRMSLKNCFNNFKYFIAN